MIDFDGYYPCPRCGEQCDIARTGRLPYHAVCYNHEAPHSDRIKPFYWLVERHPEPGPLERWVVAKGIASEDAAGQMAQRIRAAIDRTGAYRPLRSLWSAFDGRPIGTPD
jgi:hypothetical protein